MKPIQAKGIVVLSGPVIDIRVDSGCLRLKHGFPCAEPLKEVTIPRGTNDIDHIVILGKSGNITLDAISWMMDLGITVSVLDYQGNLITDMLSPKRINSVVKHRQASAKPRLQRKLAIGLLQKKLDGQLKTLKSLKREGLDRTIGEKLANRQRIGFIRKMHASLSKCKSPEEMMSVEAQAAKSYWEAFDEIPLNWKITSSKPIPDHWLSIGQRHSPKSDCGRYAIAPFHACLNYLYGCLESRIKRYCIAYRVDMDFPVLHSDDHPNRSGLIYDLMEPIRPLVDLILYRFMAKTTLQRSDFFETRQGVCKVMPELAAKIIPLLGSLDLDINQIVKEYASKFKTKYIHARPEDDPKKLIAAKLKTKGKKEIPALTLPDAFEEADTLSMMETEQETLNEGFLLEGDRISAR